MYLIFNLFLKVNNHQKTIRKILKDRMLFKHLKILHSKQQLIH